VPEFVPGLTLARAFYDVWLWLRLPVASDRPGGKCVGDPWLRSLPLTGAIDQFVDSTDVLSKPDVFPRTAEFF
jgi:hypothetical protein